MDAVATPDISLFADFRLDRRGGALYGEMSKVFSHSWRSAGGPSTFSAS